MTVREVVIWWPPQDTWITDTADPRGRFAVMALVKGVMEDIVRQNCRAVGKDPAVSASTTGVVLKVWVATTSVRPNTGPKTGEHQLATDSAGRILMEGAPHHDRTINVAAMLHNSEDHDQEMLDDVIIIGMIPCSRCVPTPRGRHPTQLCTTPPSSVPPRPALYQPHPAVYHPDQLFTTPIERALYQPHPALYHPTHLYTTPTSSVPPRPALYQPHPSLYQPHPALYHHFQLFTTQLCTTPLSSVPPRPALCHPHPTLYQPHLALCLGQCSGFEMQ